MAKCGLLQLVHVLCLGWLFVLCWLGNVEDTSLRQQFRLQNEQLTSLRKIVDHAEARANVDNEKALANVPSLRAQHPVVASKVPCTCNQRVLAQKVAQLRAANPFPKPLPPLPPAHVETFNDVFAQRRKKGFGGDANDDAHIGGWLKNDTNSWTPRFWNYLIDVLKVSSVVEVGCGAGIAAKYFLDRGVDVRCVEGSNEAIRDSNIPRNRIVQHDFTRGPWFPGTDIVDLAYSVEFMEHLNEEHLENVMTLFMSARYVVITASINEGWNHVNVHHQWWWVERFAAFGFEFSPLLTEKIRPLVCEPKKYLHRTGMVFRNVEVDFYAAFAEPGDMAKRRRLRNLDDFAAENSCRVQQGRPRVTSRQ